MGIPYVDRYLELVDNVLQYWYMIRRGGKGGGGRDGKKRKRGTHFSYISVSFFVYRAKMKGPLILSRTVKKKQKKIRGT